MLGRLRVREMRPIRQTPAILDLLARAALVALAIGLGAASLPAAPAPTPPPAPPRANRPGDPAALDAADAPVPRVAIPRAPATGRYWPLRNGPGHARAVNYLYRGADGHIRTGATGSPPVLKGNDSLRFLASRPANPRPGDTLRFHCGVDLVGADGDPVVACESGRVVRHMKEFRAFAGGKQFVGALFVQNDSGTVINYAEIDNASVELHPGDAVQAGQVIARIRVQDESAMLHFEMYEKGTTKNERYVQTDAHPPGHLLDPTAYLITLAERGD
jgi:murein DD-endopeptidase MepM/ murein hydrolase activator NlpD